MRNNNYKLLEKRGKAYWEGVDAYIVEIANRYYNKYYKLYNCSSCGYDPDILEFHKETCPSCGTKFSSYNLVGRVRLRLMFKHFKITLKDYDEFINPHIYAFGGQQGWDRYIDSID